MIPTEGHGNVCAVADSRCAASTLAPGPPARAPAALPPRPLSGERAFAPGQREHLRTAQWTPAFKRAVRPLRAPATGVKCTKCTVCAPSARCCARSPWCYGHAQGAGEAGPPGGRSGVTTRGGGVPGVGRRRGEGRAPPPRPPAPALPWTRGRRSPQRGPRAGTRAEPTEPAGTPRVQTRPAGRTAHCAGATRANRRPQRKGRNPRASQPAPAHSSGPRASGFQPPSGARVCPRAHSPPRAPTRTVCHTEHAAVNVGGGRSRRGGDGRAGRKGCSAHRRLGRGQKVPGRLSSWGRQHPQA